MSLKTINYLYSEKNGQTYGYVSRSENNLGGSKSHKDIRAHFNPNGKSGIPEGFPAHKRVYGLDSVADNSAPLFIVEGEKCAYALHGLGFQSVTSLGGANAVHKADWSILDGVKTVYLMPDNDDAGLGYMQVIYKYLQKFNHVPEVYLLDMPNAQPKGDIADWLIQHEALRQWDGLSGLHDHPHRDDLCKSFESLYQTRASHIPAEWQFIETKGKLRSINAESFSRLQLPERKYLLHPLIMEATINMFYAPRGLGKTFFCLSSGVHMAQGKTFLKFTPEKKATVLYLDGEMQAHEMKKRLKLIADEPFPKNFYLVTPDFQELEALPDLSLKDGQSLVDEMIDEINPDVIFIDNISTFMRSGNENDADSWSSVQPWLIKHRSKGRALILVHHSNKSGDQRGSNKKEDIMDVVGLLSRPDDYIQGEDRTRMILHLTKARHIFGEDAQDVEAELDTSKNKAIWSWKVSESSFDKAVMLLNEKVLSQQEIADELKVSKGTISKWKKKAEGQGLLK